METFADPLPDTYLTRSLFIMPTDSVGIRGVSVTKKEAQYLTAGYSILIAGIFGFAWQFIVYLALFFYPTEGPESRKEGQPEKDGVFVEDEEKSLEVRKRKANRYIALITIWNAGDPWSALFLLFEHATIMCFSAGDRPTGAYDIIFLVAAIIAAAATEIGATLIPSNLAMGSVAPANPESVFYATSNEVGGSIRIQQTRAPSAQRAMGTVESAREQLKERVNISPRQRMDWTGPNGEVIEQTTYNYNVTGLDFGLQHMHAIKFLVSVKGACTLEYGWFDASNSDQDFDAYDIFGQIIYVARTEISRPVGGSILLDASSLENFTKQNRSYAILPDTVARQSYYEGTDPWYKTSAIDPPACSVCPGFQVENQRPVLSCWQQDVWSYEGNTAQTIEDLGKLPGLDIPDVIVNEFIPDRLVSPMIYDIASSLGDSIFVSSTGSIGGLFDASISNYSADIERLILASFVASQNILRDTTLITSTYQLNNSARDTNNIPKPGAGDFVINSGDVVTLSLKVLISIPCLWVFLWVSKGLFRFKRHTHRNSGITSRFTLREAALQPAQMYRHLDEEICGYRDDWVGRKGELPYIKDPRPFPYHAASGTSVDGRPDIVGAGGNGVYRDEKRDPYVYEMGIQPAGETTPTTETGKRETIMSERSITTAGAVHRYPPFIAPKVAEGPKGTYRLRFTGPIPYDPPLAKGQNRVWSWYKPHGISGVVTDGPTVNGGFLVIFTLWCYLLTYCS